MALAAPPHFTAPLLSRTYRDFAALHRMIDCPAADQLAVECSLQNVLGHVLRNSESEILATRPCLRSIGRAKAYVDDMLATSLAAKITLDDLAQAANLDKFLLCRQFALGVGASPASYVTARRVARSQKLLRAGASVRRVAIECGYTEEAFCRRFLSVYGISPGQYQRVFRK